MIRSTLRLAGKLALLVVLLFALGRLSTAVASEPRCFRVGFGPVVCVDLQGPRPPRCDAINARHIYTKQCPVR